ncbi:MAG: Tetratricopeptide repeat protein [bacterium ADurb.Bin270]|jgi:predicted Zn-dependent protease|nr:MAG: Tetratricopeptide repeat protein [bacterium ADurb.Bin270]
MQSAVFYVRVWSSPKDSANWERLMIEMNREHLAAMMEAGYIYLGMKRFKEARELFEGLLVLAPESEIPSVALGNVEFCEGKLARAIKHYKVALKKDPKSYFAKVYYGEALFFSGKREEALELINEVASSDKSGAGEFARALLQAIEGGFEPKKGKGKVSK